MNVTDWLDTAYARANAATDGPWSFGQAPAEGSNETKAEYMERALTDAGPLYALFVPSTVGQEGGYLVPAITGDGPNAGLNAAFIAAARTDLPKALDALRAVLTVLDLHDESERYGVPWGDAPIYEVRDAIANTLEVQP